MEMVDVDHQGKPDLAGRGLGRTAFVDEPSKMFGFKAVNPSVNGGP